MFIRSFVFQAFRIPTGSMEETLLVGDFLFVNKFLYGAHIPFTDARLPALREPRHGDIVVFKFPKDPSRDFIKRLVGEPGDTLQIKDKVVYVNGVAQTEPYVHFSSSRIEPITYKQPSIYPAGAGNRDNYGPVVVPPGHFFMMGDNRDNSDDSRFWGFLDKKPHQGEGDLHLLVLGQRADASTADAHRGLDPLTEPSFRASGVPAAGLYVHVPFCRALCGYCAFAKREYDAGRAEAWLAGLVAEIAHRARETWNNRPAVDTVFLGGGTPSALSPRQWTRLGDILRAGFTILPEAEFTSEANPESFTPEIAAAMRGAGVNRVSLGVQSLDPSELRMLDRIHGVAEVARAVRTARDAGFDNLNLDLMYGLPGQDVETFAASLEGILALAPEHLSAYCLGLEPGTALAASVSSGALPRPDDDVARAQYDFLVARAEAAGLALYEISNFARAGRECRHNLKYWRREDFMALGPSAHALVGNRRWANPATLDAWVAAYAPGGRAPLPQPVPRAEARFEWVFLRLRLAGGFSEAAFEEAWGESIDRAFGEVPARLATQGHLIREGGRVRLHPDARFVSDAVFAEFAPER